ncbi:hypothetical protein [Devosia rhizoryzae]|uniref:hypothetical protein n=1 Tax=Devosia rhizoryzae TaxID=2774137 RepID=UPI001E37D483|nr:hypothetical protein [Devosia rhizoryzae]
MRWIEWERLENRIDVEKGMVNKEALMAAIVQRRRKSCGWAEVTLQGWAEKSYAQRLVFRRGQARVQAIGTRLHQIFARPFRQPLL